MNEWLYALPLAAATFGLWGILLWSAGYNARVREERTRRNGGEQWHDPAQQ